MKLECLASFTLWGNIMSMASATLSGSPRDSLLISFRDAKLTLVEYDPETHDLRTLSLHYFEEDEIRVCIYLTLTEYVCKLHSTQHSTYNKHNILYT
jgi:hypothetical protein